jgi:antitoxin ParD1/3/4
VSLAVLAIFAIFRQRGYYEFMATTQITRNIALTPHLDKLVQQRVASGRYQSASEVVREGLRLLEQRDEERNAELQQVRQQIEEGWQASERGEVVDGPSVFREIRKLSRERKTRARKWR